METFIFKASTQKTNVCSRLAIETLEQSVNTFKHILQPCPSGLLLTMNRLLFARKAGVNLKKLTISQVTDLT